MTLSLTPCIYNSYKFKLNSSFIFLSFSISLSFLIFAILAYFASLPSFSCFFSCPCPWLSSSSSSKYLSTSFSLLYSAISFALLAISSHLPPKPSLNNSLLSPSIATACLYTAEFFWLKSLQFDQIRDRSEKRMDRQEYCGREERILERSIGWAII